MKKHIKLLTIAGFDSGGGAGIQADLKTFSALGCYGMSVITALTAQNSVGVTGILNIEPNFIAQQLDAVLSDFGVDSVKVGMLSTPEVIEVVSDKIKQYQIKNLILDPVMVAKSGDKLLQDDAIEALKRDLIPLALIITPNLLEAEVLTNMTILNRQDMLKASEILLSLGCSYVLIKGTYCNNRAIPDLLISSERKPIWLESERFDTINTHGTGCTLSSAIASFIGTGESTINAVEKAKEYITGAIKSGALYKLGKGHGPVNHFFNLWS